MTLPYDCSCDLCRLDAISREREAHQAINALLGRLDEHQRRWLSGYLAMQYDSVSYVAIVTGMSEKTIRKGLEEIRSGVIAEHPDDRIRAEGAGRPTLR